MDPRSHRLANSLVGNGTDAATLEVTLVGPELEFEDDRVVAVAGAEFDLAIDGQPAPVHTPVAVSRGSRLRFGMRGRGARGYVAVAGGVAVPAVLGSRATHLPSRMGGFDGRALRHGDSLSLGSAQRAVRRIATLESGRLDPMNVAARAAREEPFTGKVRVLPGPQQDRFTADALDVLQSAPYVIDPQSDRMGFRLRGPRLQHAGRPEMLSDVVPLGAVQVPAGGEPILLMADRPTTGGYPSLATVITADIGIAGQLAPGDSIRFVMASHGEAIAALIAQERTLAAVGAGVW